MFYLGFLDIDVSKFSFLIIFLSTLGVFVVHYAIRTINHVFFDSRYKTIIWAIDIIFVPSFVICLEMLCKKFSGTEAIGFHKTVNVIALAIVWFMGAWLFSRGLEIFLWDENFEKLTGTESPRLLRGLISAIIYFFSIYCILTYVFKLAVAGLLIPTGIIAGVIGLALQNVLANLFASLAIAIEKPYRVGDWIEIDDKTVGKVVDITWRSTRLLSWNNSIYAVPNSVATNSIIHNYALPDPTYAAWFHVSVDAKVSPLVVERLLLDAALACKRILKKPAPFISIFDITNQPLKYMIYVYFDNYRAHWAAKNELFISVQQHFWNNGFSPAAIKMDIASGETPEINVQGFNVLEHLRKADIFSPLTNEEIEIVAKGSQLRTMEQDVDIINENDIGSSLFIILSGVVVILKKNVRGENMELAQLASGSCIGEMSLLTGEKRFATAKSMTYVTLVEVPKGSLEIVLKSKPELSDKLTDIMVQRKAKMGGFNNQDPDSLKVYTRRLLRKIHSFFGIRQENSDKKREKENGKTKNC